MHLACLFARLFSPPFKFGRGRKKKPRKSTGCSSAEPLGAAISGRRVRFEACGLRRSKYPVGFPLRDGNADFGGRMSTDWQHTAGEGFPHWTRLDAPAPCKTWRSRIRFYGAGEIQTKFGTISAAQHLNFQWQLFVHGLPRHRRPGSSDC